MAKGIKKEFVLEGLDCANCAAKIEEKVNGINGVASASMNFATKKLLIETGNDENVDRIVSDAKDIIKKLEPQVKMIEAKHADHDHVHSEGLEKHKLILFGAGAVLFFTAAILALPSWAEFGLYFLSFILVGGEVLLTAARNILCGQFFDENFLMSIATIGAFAIREYPEGAAVMLFYQIGEFFQSIAVNRSRKYIASLMDIRPDYANLKVDDEVKKVSPDEVGVGSLILVRPGEKVPLDGKVNEGKSMLDTSALTGESIPREVQPGSEVLSGSVNQNGLLIMEVTKAFRESTVSKILDMVQNASNKKAPTENFITKFAKYYTPLVVVSAAALAVIPPLLLPGETFAEWLNRALVFLVVSCPCALVVSIPLGFFGGIGGASKNGILVKGGNYLEALNNVDTVVFDKTGTLTKGVFKVTKLIPVSPISDTELLEYAAHAESYSNHPIALSIQKAYGKNMDKSKISNYNEIPGHGIKVTVKGKAVLAGNGKLMQREGIVFEEVQSLGTAVYLAVNGYYAGAVVISDEIKDDSKNAIAELRNVGVKKLVMLTGDIQAVGEKIGRDLGLDEVYAELLPDQKVEKLEMLEWKKTTKGKLVFVGDGVNDAPVLAQADVGVAMGGVGSDAAIEAADVVLMTDEPSKLVAAIRIARRTRNIVWQNIVFALGVKSIVLILGAGGIATMWEAVFADVGVALLAVLNAMRVMKSK